MESVADEAAAPTTTSRFRGSSTEVEGSEVTEQGKDTVFMCTDSLSCPFPINLLLLFCQRLGLCGKRCTELLVVRGRKNLKQLFILL